MRDGKRLDDARYLRAEQYRDGGNLSARVDLHQAFSTNQDGWFRWVFDRIAVTDGERVLDVGCGTGSLWLENGDRLSPAARLTLADLSPGMVEGTRRRLAGLAAGLTYCVADARSIPFAAGVFDVVIANHMLYHVPDSDRPRALREIGRVLRPGGRFYAATNGRDHLRELDELIWTVAPEARRDNSAAAFGLENGARQLNPWFEEVGRHDYPDGLAVTAVEPLVAYVLSTRAKEFLDQARLDAMRTAVAEEIAGAGAFRVTKEVGLFRCVTGA